MANTIGKQLTQVAVVITALAVILTPIGVWFDTQSDLSAAELMAKETKLEVVVVKERVRIMENVVIGLKSNSEHVENSLKEQKIALDRYVQKQEADSIRHREKHELDTTRVIEAIRSIRSTP